MIYDNLRKLRNWIAPNMSRRYTAYSICREAFKNPLSLLHRVNDVNFVNARVISHQTIICNICGISTKPYYDFPNLKTRKDHGIGILRETVCCRSCGSTMRERTVASKLLEAINASLGEDFKTISSFAESDKSLDILDTDSFWPVYTFLHGKKGYKSCRFIPEKSFGTVFSDGSYNVDLQKICFSDNMFDIVISSEVMEHVRDDNAAHREITRILKPGATYVFTVPYKPAYYEHEKLVLAAGNNDILLTAPHYHGDPITGGILAYRIYGRQLFKDFEALGLKLDFEVKNDIEIGIYLGDVFAANKMGEIS